MPEPLFIGWMRVMVNGRLTRWKQVVTGATEKEARIALFDFESGQHKHRDLCVRPIGKHPND